MRQEGGTAQRQNPEEEKPVPIWQEIYDNIWLLFLLSVVIVLVAYIGWGLIDLLNKPTAP